MFNRAWGGFKLVLKLALILIQFCLQSEAECWRSLSGDPEPLSLIRGFLSIVGLVY